MNEKIFLVEDDKNLNPVLASYLMKEGYRVSSFENGESAEVRISEQPDLWILDIMLPGMDGSRIACSEMVRTVSHITMRSWEKLSRCSL